MEFYCSEKFRINGNHTRVDIWLIYKCIKCDTTLKLTIKRGIKPHSLSKELFDQFTNNDASLAWKYAFDRQFLKQHECEVNYANVKYSIEGFESPDLSKHLHIHLKSQYIFDLKLSTFLANALDISVGKIKKLAINGMVMTSPKCDIIKYRIRSDIDIQLRL